MKKTKLARIRTPTGPRKNAALMSSAIRLVVLIFNSCVMMVLEYLFM